MLEHFSWGKSLDRHTKVTAMKPSHALDPTSAHDLRPLAIIRPGQTLVTRIPITNLGDPLLRLDRLVAVVRQRSVCIIRPISREAIKPMTSAAPYVYRGGLQVVRIQIQGPAARMTDKTEQLRRSIWEGGGLALAKFCLLTHKLSRLLPSQAVG